MKDTGWGRVIFMSGIIAYIGMRNHLHNVTTNAGLNGFTRGLAQEVAE
jgi:NAD(P)-dependent dehydrogenase (short-subunit alcohol dehydrogenase family)